MHGGVKFYRGAAKAARAYVERDRSRADDYYLGEGTGVAARLTATPDGVEHAGSMDGDTYEQWVAGIDIETGATRRVGSATTRTRCGSSRSRSTDPRPGHWPRRFIRRSRPRWTRPRTRPPARSSAGSLSTRRPGSGRADGRCRYRSRRSRPPSSGTTRPEPGTRTGTFTCRSTPASTRPAGGGASTRSGSGTASRRSTGSVMPRSPPTRGSGRSSRRTGSPSTRRPARSSSWRRSWVRSAPGPRRSAATSTATRPPGAATTRARSRVRGCGRRGTGGRGPKPGPTRSSRPTAESSWPAGTVSCASSATATQPTPRS